MSKQEKNGSPMEEYQYYWNYNAQCDFEKKQNKRKNRRGAVVYTLVMVSVFLLCFAILAASLVWYLQKDPVQSPPLTNNDQGDSAAGAVAQLLNPATVLVYASNSTSYGYGTGFFIRSDGYIATNYHTVDSRDFISVTLYDGNVLEATLVGYSEYDDLAVLKIVGKNYPVPAIGNSDGVRVGDIAVAVGNPSGPDGAWSTTQGIISALNRKVEVSFDGCVAEMNMLQTDTPLNKGNSGGPLCNAKGEVIGIVTRKMNDFEGISYAIPINGAMEIMEQIIKTGSADGIVSKVTKVRPLMGITASTVAKGDTYIYNGKTCTAERDGVLVGSVSDTGAARGILMVQDIIVAMDGEPVTDLETMTELLYKYRVGETAEVTVWRNGEEITVKMIMGKTK